MISYGAKVVINVNFSVPDKLHTSQVSRFWGETPDFAPRLPPCAGESPDLGSISLKSKSTKLFVFTAV